MIVGNGVKTIGSNVFASNQLTSLTLGAAVETIESGAFEELLSRLSTSRTP